MKTRNGFVSNSSSSSFVAYGTSLSEDDLENIAKKLGVNKDWKIYAELEKKYPNLSIENNYYIGRSYSTIKDDETGLQFKDKTKQEIEELLGREVELQYIEECSYDG